eukprot:m.181000 g.181000  ORF g.181000 m.181000 type:complete len:354 (-) comp15509_c0_seq15:1411-2472(-)
MAWLLRPFASNVPEAAVAPTTHTESISLLLTKRSGDEKWGFHFTAEQNGKRVISVAPGSPSERGGLIVTDIIVAVNGDFNIVTDKEKFLQILKSNNTVDLRLLRDPAQAIKKPIIIDVRVQRGNEVEGPNYITLSKSVGGSKADVNNGYFGKETYFAYTKADMNTLPPDTLVVEDVTIVEDRVGACPPGFEVIRRTNTDHNADLNAGFGGDKLFLAVKRMPLTAAKKRIIDLAVMIPAKREHVPAGFVQIPKDINQGSLQGNSVFLCVKYDGSLPHDAVHPPAPVPKTSIGFDARAVMPEVKLQQTLQHIHGLHFSDPPKLQKLTERDIDQRFQYFWDVEHETLNMYGLGDST